MLMRRREHENRVGMGEDLTLYQESHEELYSLMVLQYYLLAQTHDLLVSLPHKSMGTLMRCYWESCGLLLLYHPSSSPLFSWSCRLVSTQYSHLMSHEHGKLLVRCRDHEHRAGVGRI